MKSLSDIKIAIIGLGYVGLPLAVEFSTKYQTVGFDINVKRINQLKDGIDITQEVSNESLKGAKFLRYGNDTSEIEDADVYIVTVPTPISEQKQPDLTPLKRASEMLGNVIAKDNIVIYESTVYPGATEEVCIPIIEEVSGLKFNKDFYAGYSPERINPGDKENTLTKITKITSGSTPEIAEYIDQLYGSIITAGTYCATSIKVAEAAKVIENTQRDLNIAVINEFSKIFNKLNIDTELVLEAAATKWNFLKFKPGLVGGHCIGVDPYYLTFKAQEVGYRPEVILAGRRINDGMSEYVASQMVKAMSKKHINIDKSKVLVMGITFKGDCPDIRNSKVFDVIKELSDFNVTVDVCDNWADPEEVYEEYNVNLISAPKHNDYDGIILAVDHTAYKELGSEAIHKFGKEVHVLYDVKHVFAPDEADIRL